MVDYECHKTRFATKEDALFYLKKIRKESTREIIPVRAYLCRCKAWHLTSQQAYNSGEVKRLNDIINTLRENIKKLKTENALLRSNTGGIQNEKAEKKVIELQNALAEKDRLARVLRNHISELLTRLCIKQNTV